jgi:hypothetical protein
LRYITGTLRFSENFSSTHGIGGPAEHLRLDYSQVTEILNQMQVSPAYVRLQWEMFDEHDGTETCVSWRVSVRATTTIRPFEVIVRSTVQQEQHSLHLSPTSAQKGFLNCYKAS